MSNHNRSSYSLSLFCAFIFAFSGFSQNLTVTNYAGNGTSVFSAGNQALETGFDVPSGIAVDSEGNIYFFVAGVLSEEASGLYKIDAETNELEKILTGVSGISGVDIDKDDNVYFCFGIAGDLEPNPEYIYYINGETGVIDTLAGNGIDGVPVNGALARSTPMGNSGGLKVDPNSEYLYYSAVFGGKNFIQRINLETRVTTRVAGVGGPDGAGDIPDGTLALEADINLGVGLAWDSYGNLYFNTINARTKVIKADDNKIYHVAGTGESEYNGDDIPAAEAALNNIGSGLYINQNNELFICDRNNNRIRTIDLFPASGEPMITTFCGTGFEEGDGENPSGDLENGFFKDLDEANVSPTDILNYNGELYFTDIGVNRIRKIRACEQPVFESVSASSNEVCNGENVILTVDGELGDGSNWAWYSDECGIGTIPESTNPNYEVQIDESTTFFVAAVGGCLSNEVCKEIDIEVTCKEFYNAFSPNRDGVNEFLEIPAIANYNTNTVIIYNRWGQEITRVTDYNNEDKAWFGTYNGTSEGDVVDSGTYFFTAEANGEIIVSGWVQVVK